MTDSPPTLHDAYVPRSILVAGGGVIGRSLAVAYAGLFPQAEISIYDNDRRFCEVLRDALDEQGITNLRVLSEHNQFLEAASRADFLDNCVPIDKMECVQKSVQYILPPGSLITNRGSAQGYALAQISPHVREGTYHFGAHMLVGREVKAGEALSCYPEMFEGQTCVIEALADQASQAQRSAHQRIISINEHLGMNVKALPVRIHDQLLGALSHENTASLRALVSTVGKIETGLGATIMRASAGSAAMWVPVYQFNQAAVGRGVQAQSQAFDEMKAALLASDKERFTGLVREAHAFRMTWPDADEPVESLGRTQSELYACNGSRALQNAEQILLPLFFTVSRTLGFRETVRVVGSELEKHGHGFMDLLNSSAKDSTLGAKYNPDMLVLMMWENKEPLGVMLSLYERNYQGFSDALARVSYDPEAAQELYHSIDSVKEVMTDPDAVLPRRLQGGQGFSYLQCAQTPGVIEGPLLPCLSR